MFWGRNKAKWITREDETECKKGPMVIEIHFHLYVRAGYFFWERDWDLMWITLQSRPGKMELAFCICMCLNPNFQGVHNRTVPKFQGRHQKEAIMQSLSGRERDVKLKRLFRLCVMNKCDCIELLQALWLTSNSNIRGIEIISFF